MHNFSQLVYAYLHDSKLTMTLGLVHLCFDPHAHVVDTLLVASLLAHSLGRHLCVFGAEIAVFFDKLDGVVLQNERFFIFMARPWFLLFLHDPISGIF